MTGFSILEPWGHNVEFHSLGNFSTWYYALLSNCGIMSSEMNSYMDQTERILLQVEFATDFTKISDKSQV